MEESRRTVIEATAAVYHQHAIALRAIVPVIKQFDGKVLNKRLDTAMKEAVGKSYYVRWLTEYGWLKIELGNMDNRYRTGQYSCGYTRNREWTVYCGTYADCLETTESGKWRLKGDVVAAKLEEDAAEADKRCEMLLDSLQNGDEIIKEIAEVCESLIEKRNKYDSEVLELLGVYVAINNLSPDPNRLVKTF